MRSTPSKNTRLSRSELLMAISLEWEKFLFKVRISLRKSRFSVVAFQIFSLFSIHIGLGMLLPHSSLPHALSSAEDDESFLTNSHSRHHGKYFFLRIWQAFIYTHPIRLILQLIIHFLVPEHFLRNPGPVLLDLSRPTAEQI